MSVDDMILHLRGKGVFFSANLFAMRNYLSVGIAYLHETWLGSDLLIVEGF
jgi:hypothetical protein